MFIAFLVAATAIPQATAIDPASWFSPSNYPVEAMKKGIEGSVTFDVDVDAEGKPTACRITASSGSPILDQATCHIVQSKGRFVAARRPDGKPVAGHYSSRAIWRMSNHPPAQPQPLSEPTAATVQPITSLGYDKEESTTARIVESDDSIRFEISSPEYIVPSVAIDADRNGKIDPDVDFMAGFTPHGLACVFRLLAEGKTSTCLPLNGKVQVTKQQTGNTTNTVFIFPKNAISTDGFGFGFSVNLENVKEHNGVALASGDYRFGGFLKLITDGPNFLGEAPVPAQIMPAIHRYGGCLDRGTRALLPLEASKLQRLKAVPSGCAADRAAALDEAVRALVETGADKEQSQRAMRGVFDQIDARFAILVHALEGARPPKK